MNETEPAGRLTVWRVYGSSDEFCLRIDLDYDRAVLLQISSDGDVITTLSQRFND